MGPASTQPWVRKLVKILWLIWILLSTFFRGYEVKREGGVVVTVFLSTYVNGVDKKGRISVPASFRTEMAAHSRQMIVVHAAPEGGYLYAWSYDDFVKLAENIKKMPPLAPERQRLARTLLAAARPLNFDSEGRILVPEELLGKAKIDEKALFAGQGDYFTIWNPEAFENCSAADEGHFSEDIALLSAAWEADGA